MIGLAAGEKTAHRSCGDKIVGIRFFPAEEGAS
ncbi:hypothetical protein SK3146_01239 [Paenibacillus konkukensis]|uniref:Uncharacterized protein n=1 Tax=Paenibacillus konkukensis TaxID=2020716 RepID=A0ABY4RIR5_9BACL|nr:hypothetical protein SK3146_01239 [Paenibacillus konkukensis]